MTSKTDPYSIGYWFWAEKANLPNGRTIKRYKEKEPLVDIKTDRTNSQQHSDLGPNVVWPSLFLFLLLSQRSRTIGSENQLQVVIQYQERMNVSAQSLVFLGQKHVEMKWK